MRATWISSAVVGLPFGFVATLATIGSDKQRGASFIAAWIIGVLFVPMFVVCVFGISQLREIQVKRRTRSSWLSHQIEDGPAFLVPVWGRLAVFFVAAAAGSALSKAFE